MSEAFSSQIFHCHNHRQEVRETVPQRPVSRAAAAAVAIVLSAGLSAGTLVLAVPASAAVAQAPLSAAQANARESITSTFNAMNAFRASKGMPPVKLGLDASELLQASLDDWNIDMYGPDSIAYSSRIKGYSSFASGTAFPGDTDGWIRNLLADSEKNVVGIAADATFVAMTSYAYRTVPDRTFDTAEAYFAYVDQPQLLGPAPMLAGTPVWGSTLTAGTGTWPAGTKFAYQWMQTNEYGYTSPAEGSGKAYPVSDQDLNRKLSVRVTATLPGFRAAVVYSALTPAIQKPASVSNTKAPAITGAYEAGQKLTANPGTWEPGTALTYQWLGGYGVPAGSNSNTFTPTKAGKYNVAVTGSKPGMRSTTVTTAEIDVIDLNTGIPTQTFGDWWKVRDGAPAVGEEFHAWFLGDWLPGTTLTRQWTRNGAPVAGATGSSYKLTTADVGTRIALAVTGSRAGNQPRTVSAAPSEKIAALRPLVVNTVRPVISGGGLVGKKLTVSPGTWTPGTRLTYQWTMTMGVTTFPIAGATAATYTPTAKDDGGMVSVDITGWKDGYVPLRTGGIGSGTARVAPVAVHKAIVVAPVIKGLPIVGKTLTAEVWNSGASLKYQWKRNGAAIPGATAAAYKVTAADIGRKITLTVSGSLAGYPAASATSAPTGAVTQEATYYYRIPTFSWPTNGSLPKVGQTIRMTSPGTWTPGTKLTFQWTRNGAPIAKATGSSYKLVVADAGKRVGVTVTGQAPNCSKVVYRDLALPVRR
jgi:hypothetical protein